MPLPFWLFVATSLLAGGYYAAKEAPVQEYKSSKDFKEWDGK